MIEFEVNRNRIIRYLNKFGFNDPEEFFYCDGLGNGQFIYSIDISEVSYDDRLLKVDLKNTIAIYTKEAKWNHNIPHSIDAIYEELIFLVCYIGVYKDYGVTTNLFAETTYKNITSIIDAALYLKQGQTPIGIQITFDGTKKSSRKAANKHEVLFNTFSSGNHLFSVHYLSSLAKFLNINTTTKEFNVILDPKSTSNDLQLLKKNMALTYIDQNDNIKLKTLDLMRAFLEEQLNIM